MPNTTDPITTPTTLTIPHLQENWGAAFYGFAIGAILFGITIRQAYQYYTTVRDTWVLKTIIAVVCILDTLNLLFAMHMVYSFVLQLLGFKEAGSRVVLSLKGFGTVQVVLILLVQGFYLSQIWRFARASILLSRGLTKLVQVFVIFIAVFALVVSGIFLSQLNQIQMILSFSSGFEYVVYLGFGATALIDCAIAAMMCVILHKSGGGTERSESVLETLIQYFVGSGLLTSFAAILGIVMYVAKPDSLLYLGVEFSVTRLYANSMLALFNARKSMRERLEQTIMFTPPSGIFNDEPSSYSRRSRNHHYRHTSHALSLLPSPDSENPFKSPDEAKYGEFYTPSSSPVQVRRDGSISSRTYTV